MKHLHWLIVPAIGALGLGGYYFSHAKPAALSAWMFGERKIAVSVATPRRAVLPVIVRLTGALSAAQEANIVSRLAGKVLEVRFRVGDSIPAGAIVAIVESGSLAARTSELEEALKGARDDVKSSEERAARVEHQVGQNREWYRQDLIPRRDLEQAEAAAKTAQAAAELARAQLAQQESMLAQVRALQSLTRLAAPFGGMITERWAEPGSVVKESAPIVSVANVNRLKLTGDYGGPYSNDVHIGMKAEIAITGSPEKKFAARVGSIEEKVEGEKSLRQIGVEVENFSAALRPGMAAQALIELAKQEEVLLVPGSAVVALEGKHYVYKVVDGRAVRQEIILAAENGADVAIKEGVGDGDSVIVDNQQSLKPQSPVHVVQTNAPFSRPVRQ